MRIFFLEKSYTKWGRENILRPFSKKLKLSISLDQWPKLFTVSFYSMPSWGLSKYIKIKPTFTYFYLIQSFFKKQKEIWNYSPGLLFSMLFEEFPFEETPSFLHAFLLFYPIKWPNFDVWLPLLREILNNRFIIIVC